jgi:flavin-dependent dehydrogenase
VERAAFDDLLLRAAQRAGAKVRQDTAVKQVLRLADGDVALRLDDGSELTGRYVIDASGQHTVLARHLGTRVPAKDPCLRKVAHFDHFENVARLPGDEIGHPAIVMAEEGWFWMINIDDRRTSVGLVIDADLAKQTGVPADRMLAWGVARCPLVRLRMVDAIPVGDGRNHTIANFSYRCRPYAGDGYFLVGDAAAFLDPIFSTGVCLAMTEAVEAAQLLARVLKRELAPAKARRRYNRFAGQGTGVFFKLIRQYYTHSFRELFLNGTGPLKVHKAVLAALAGHVFPRPSWPVRWRLALFGLCVALNQWLPLVPRRPRFSLLAGDVAASEFLQTDRRPTFLTPSPVAR